VQYSYDDHTVVVVNSAYASSPRLRVIASVYDLNLNELFSKDLALTIDADTSQRAISIPDTVFSGSSKMFFVNLTLQKQTGEVLSRNFYWVPATLTTFDWPKTDFTHTPAITHEDMTALASLPKARVEAEIRTANSADNRTVELRLRNPSKVLAFQVALAARDAHGDDITPVVWSDNYVELMPGETRVLQTVLPAHVPENAVIVLSGWNIPGQTLHLSSAKTIAER
jgi:exo-1,4-beta-D-glucosaminidase